MSLRLAVLALVVIWLCIQAWRGKWLLSACGVIVMMAFVERKDMRLDLFGLTGRNLWNILLINTTWAWLVLRRQQDLTWDFPVRLKKFLIAYLFVVVLAFLRLIIDPTPYIDEGRITLTWAYLINPLKFLIPACILFDGCRTRKQLTFALGAVLLTYLILACFTIKYMGIGNFSGRELSARAARVIARDVGYHRVDMSMMLAGASWGLVAFSLLFKSNWVRVSLWGSAVLVVLGQALTGGRAGYVTWFAIGLMLCLLRWRKLLPLIPVAVLMVFAFAPGVRERVFEGFAQKKGSLVQKTDAFEVTAGRNNAWPLVIEKIMDAPLLGYGRSGMVRTGLTTRLENEYNDRFGHPHNAYLEQLLDNGVLGFLCIMPIFFLLLGKCCNLFMTSADMLACVAGGVAFCLLSALLIAALGAQTFYPREGVVGMAAALGLALRAWVEREKTDDEELIMPDAEDAEA